MSALPDPPKRSDSAEAKLTLRSTPPLPPIARNSSITAPDTEISAPDAADRLGMMFINVLIQLISYHNEVYDFCQLKLVLYSINVSALDT